MSTLVFKKNTKATIEPISRKIGKSSLENLHKNAKKIEPLNDFMFVIGPMLRFVIDMHKSAFHIR